MAKYIELNVIDLKREADIEREHAYKAVDVERRAKIISALDAVATSIVAINFEDVRKFYPRKEIGKVGTRVVYKDGTSDVVA